jgi:hypothetical protein
MIIIVLVISGVCVTGCCWYSSMQKQKRIRRQHMQAVQIAPIHQFPAAQQIGQIRQIIGPNGQPQMVMTVPVNQQSKIRMANDFFEREKKSIIRDRSLATSMVEEGNVHSAAMDQKISKNRRASQARLERRIAQKKKQQVQGGV